MEVFEMAQVTGMLFEQTGDASAVTQLKAAKQLHQQSRAQGLAALNELFRAGRVPEGVLHGRYPGQLIALEIAPGLTQFYEALTNRWLPWQGKAFAAQTQTGNNIFTRDALPLSYLFMPLYHVRLPDGPDHFRSFNFRTYTAPGLQDPDRQVLKIDYDLPENPRFTIRRVVDELVQIGDGLYLGKAHLRWWWGKWQLVAYFALSSSE
jgi:hypothetical protein